jgi:myo-inositol-1(or 4)-monophosphatase
LRGRLTSPPNTLNLAPYLDFALELIKLSRENLLDYYDQNQSKQSLGTTLKKDKSPVTELDKSTEQVIRDAIKNKYPEHGVVGEELGIYNQDSPFLWIIDPIDGTQDIINNIPTFGTLIGLRIKDPSLLSENSSIYEKYYGTAVLGIIDHPALKTMIYGMKDSGAYQLNYPNEYNLRKAKKLPTLNQLETSTSLGPLDIITISAPDIAERTNDLDQFINLPKYHKSIRVLYNCYAHTLTLQNSTVASLEHALNIWDFTPIEVLTKEVGGEYRITKTNFKTEEPEDFKFYCNVLFGVRDAVEMIGAFLKE